MTLKQYIEKLEKNKNFFISGISNTAAICVAFPETDNNGDYIDRIAWSIKCDNCGMDIVYTWIQTDKILTASRQVVKYGRKPGSCDGEDLTPYITKYGKRYWLDDFVRIV